MAPQRTIPLFVFTALLAHAPGAGAQTFIWLGGQEPSPNNWNFNKNWSPDTNVPGTDGAIGANVIIPEASPLCIANQVAEIGTLTATGALVVRVSTFTMQGAATFNTVTFATPTGTTPQVTFGSTAAFNGTTVWQHADFLGTGPITVDGSLSIIPPGGSKTRKLDGIELIANTDVAQSGDLELLNNGKVTNNAEWSIDNTDIAPDFIGAQGLLENNATVQATGGIVNISVPVLNESGTFRSTSGAEFNLLGGGTFTGGELEVVPPDGAGTSTLVLGGTDDGPFITGPVSASGDGVFALRGEEIAIETGGSLTMEVFTGEKEGAFIDEGAVINCDGMLINNAICRWEDGALTQVFDTGDNGFHNAVGLLIALPKVGAGEHVLATRLRNTAPGVVEQSADLIVEPDGAVENLGAATYVLFNGADVLAGDDGAGVFINEGTLETDTMDGPGDGDSRIEVPFIQRQGGSTADPDAIPLVFTAPSQWGPGSTSFSAVLGSISFEAPISVVSGTHTINGTGSEFRIDVSGDDPPAIDIAPGAQIISDIFKFVLERGTISGGDAAFINENRFRWESGTIAMGLPGGVGFVNNRDVRITTPATKTLTGSMVNFGSLEDFSGVEQTGGSLQLIGAEIVNDGGWLLDATAGIAMDESSVFTNTSEGEVVGRNGSSGQGMTRIDNEGVVKVESGFLGFEEVVQIVDGVLTGGIWFVQPGATLVLPPFDTIGLGAAVTAGQEGIGELAFVGEINGGALEANGDITFEGPSLDITNGGDLIVGPVDAFVPDTTNLGAPDDPKDPDDNGSILDEMESTLTISLNGGDEQLPTLTTGTLNVWARLLPGGDEGCGPFVLNGDLAMKPTGRLLVDLCGAPETGAHDTLTVNGVASLGGTLEVTPAPGEDIEEGDTFTVLTADAIDGAFTEVVSDSVIAFDAIYTDTTVEVVSGPAPDPCEVADVDGSGNVGSPDLNLVLGDFGCAGGGCVGDANSDGVTDSLDLNAVLAVFGDDCGM